MITHNDNILQECDTVVEHKVATSQRDIGTEVDYGLPIHGVARIRTS